MRNHSTISLKSRRTRTSILDKIQARNSDHLEKNELFQQTIQTPLSIDANARIFVGTVVTSCHRDIVVNKITDKIFMGLHNSHTLWLERWSQRSVLVKNVYFFSATNNSQLPSGEKSVKVDKSTSSFNASHSVYWPRMVNERVAGEGGKKGRKEFRKIAFEHVSPTFWYIFVIFYSNRTAGLPIPLYCMLNFISKPP